MGGTPIGAIAVLGWPVKELSLEIAQTALKGASEKCHEAGIVVAGGHSVDNPEPVFGLAVSGLVDLSCLKLNSTAREGDLLFLTKPLGVGILSTAGKKGVLRASDRRRALEIMLKLNSVGRDLGQVKAVRALTDVTGFGLLGHLSEMCSASGLAATLYFEKIPLVDDLRYYIQKGCTTGGGKRNWESYAHKVRVADEFAQVALSDPQTNGGLLVAVDPGELRTFEAIIRQHDLGDALGAIGHLQRKSNDRPEIVVC
jgi:selenide,water dikinase